MPAINVELPSGERVEFPEGTSEDTINEGINRLLYPLDIQQEPVPQDDLQRAARDAQSMQQTFGKVLPSGITSDEPIDVGGTKITAPPGQIGLPQFRPPAEAGVGEKVAAGLWNVGAGAVNFPLSPSGVSTLLGSELAPAALSGPLLKLAFGGLMAKGAAEAAGTASVTKDPQDITEAAGSLAALGLIAKGGPSLPGAAREALTSFAENLARKKGLPDASRIKEEQTSVLGGIGGRGRESDNIVQAARGISEAIRKGDAQGLQQQLTSSGLDQSEFRRVIELLPAEEQAALQTLGDVVSGGRSLSEATQKAVTLFGRKAGASPITGELPADENAGITGQEAGSTEAGVGAPGGASIGTLGTQPQEKLSNASKNKTAAAIHGHVRSLEESSEVVPAEEGGAGVQPQAQGVAQAAHVPLTPEEIQYIDSERGSIDAPVQIVDEPLDPGQPFAKQIATIDRATGRVLINPSEFSAWLKAVPEGQKRNAVRSLLAEERIHLAVDDPSAESYWSNLTSLEKAIERKRYTGKWGGLANLTDTQMGHEALRFRLQQLGRMEPREIAEATRLNRIGLKSITALEDIVRGLRERFATKASLEQLSILDRIQENLGVAKAVAGGADPSAYRKGRKDTSEQEFMFLPPPEQGETIERSVWPQPTPNAIEAAANAHFEDASKAGRAPSFDDFQNELKGQYGSGISRDATYYAWQDAMTKRLMTAKGAELDKMMDRLGIRKETEYRPTPDAIADIPQDRETGQIRMDLERVKAKSPYEFSQEQRRRYTAIGAIMDTLTKEQGEPPKRAWSADVGPEDVGQRYSVTEPSKALPGQYGMEHLTPYEVETKPLFRTFTADEAKNPEAVAKLAVRNAGVDASGKGAPPRTVSKNLMAVRAPDGKIILASVWDEPRSGPRVTNVEVPKGETQRLENVLKTYQPVAMMTLREPRQYFHKVFENQEAFDKYFGDLGIEGTPSIKSSMFTGPNMGLAEATPPAETPGAVRKQQSELVKDVKDALTRVILRMPAKADIFRLRDAADHEADLNTENAKQSIIVASRPSLPEGATKADRQALEQRAKMNRIAAVAYVVSGGKANKLKFYRQALSDARDRVKRWEEDPNPLKRREAAKDKVYIKTMMEGLQWARDRWKDPDFIATGKAVKDNLAGMLEEERKAGKTLEEYDNYYPGVWEGDFWNSDFSWFAGRKLLGQQYRMPKRFHDPFEAIADGPYRLASTDSADITAHRMRQGYRWIAGKQFDATVKSIRDRVTGEPIAMDAIPVWKDVIDPETGTKDRALVGYKSPKPGYEVVGKADPIAMMSGYKQAYSWATAPSAIEQFAIGTIPVGKAALVANQLLKHNVILLWDTFHPGRLLQYATAMTGFKKPGYLGGSAALSLRPEDIPKAIDSGYITKEAGDWALGKIAVQTRHGPMEFTRQEVLREMVGQGFNAKRFTDALYREAIQNVPVIGEAWNKIVGPWNKWLFDDYIPGMMAEVAVHNFEKMNAANPNTHFNKIMRDVARDTNIFFGNMGRQGIFKSRTAQDLGRLFLLAPLWQEGLFTKELSMAMRTLGAGARGVGLDLPYRRGLPAMGALGNAMGRGLFTYFVATQAINMLSRGHPTWQNEEEGHKLDAWVPVPYSKNGGFWLSMLSTFAEVTHDIIRLHATKPTWREAAMQLGMNRASPVAKMGLVGVTGTSPAGQRYATTPGWMAGAASQVIPGVGAAPITFSIPARAAAHALFPGSVSPNQPGAAIRQALAAGAGIKTEIPQTNVQQAGKMTRDFMDAAGLRKDQGWMQVQTDQPSYAKLRTALRMDDQATATKMLKEIRKTHSDEQIEQAMKIWAKRPWTGSYDNDQRLFMSLTDKQLETFNRADLERMDLLNSFYSLLMKE